MKKLVSKLSWLAVPTLACSQPLAAAAAVGAVLPTVVAPAANVTVSGLVTDRSNS